MMISSSMFQSPDDHHHRRIPVGQVVNFFPDNNNRAEVDTSDADVDIKKEISTHSHDDDQQPNVSPYEYP
ncbi:hypothetical protein LINPERHAP1_LOCUS26170 [Linum perenne]